ncbi:MAG: hypothetical protein V5A55_10615 [Halovenus sp.]
MTVRFEWQGFAAIEERDARLDERRAAGEINEGTYRAQVAGLSAQTANARALTNSPDPKWPR